MKKLHRFSHWIPVLGLFLVPMKPVSSVGDDPYFDIGWEFYASAILQGVVVGLLIGGFKIFM